MSLNEEIKMSNKWTNETDTLAVWKKKMTNPQERVGMGFKEIKER